MLQRCYLLTESLFKGCRHCYVFCVMADTAQLSVFCCVPFTRARVFARLGGMGAKLPAFDSVREIFVNV